VETATPPYRELFDLRDRRAVVVGGAGGIGQVCVGALSAWGASVVCADINLESANGVAERMRADGQDVSACLIDIRSGESVRQICADLGSADILVVTPGINVRRRLLDLDDASIESVVGLNLVGVARTIREFARSMTARGAGSIIVFSSIRSTVVESGQSIYAATKAGIVMLAKGAAAELGGANVRVNAISPGVVETALTRPIRENAPWRDAYATKTALRRWARPTELAGAVVFLASDASSYVTGTELFVDGGWTAIDGRFDPPV